MTPHMKKLICLTLLSVTFAPPHTLSHPSFPEMSKPSLSSLLSQVTELTTQFAALSARVDNILSARAAPAPAEVKVKKAPKQKDPDAPKRAPGAYVLFCQAERAKTPDVKLKLEELGTRWRALTDEERASFKSVPAAAASAAPAAKTTFQEVHDVALTMSSTVAGKFLRFCVQNPTLSAKTAEARFKALSPEQKAKFNDPADDTDEDDDDSSDDDE